MITWSQSGNMLWPLNVLNIKSHVFHYVSINFVLRASSNCYKRNVYSIILFVLLYYIITIKYLFKYILIFEFSYSLYYLEGRHPTNVLHKLVQRGLSMAPKPQDIVSFNFLAALGLVSRCLLIILFSIIKVQLNLLNPLMWELFKKWNQVNYL